MSYFLTIVSRRGRTMAEMMPSNRIPISASKDGEAYIKDILKINNMQQLVPLFLNLCQDQMFPQV